ncbi:voltage-gated chloride channel protein, partial [Burkholderia sp. SIMBA_062]
MKYLKSLESFAMVVYLARWLLLSCVLGALAGTASAVFLFALDLATGTRVAHP